MSVTSTKYKMYIILVSFGIMQYTNSAHLGEGQSMFYPYSHPSLMIRIICQCLQRPLQMTVTTKFHTLCVFSDLHRFILNGLLQRQDVTLPVSKA